jgi:hypothetical protein
MSRRTKISTVSRGKAEAATTCSASTAVSPYTAPHAHSAFARPHSDARHHVHSRTRRHPSASGLAAPPRQQLVLRQRRRQQALVGVRLQLREAGEEEELRGRAAQLHGVGDARLGGRPRARAWAAELMSSRNLTVAGNPARAHTCTQRRLAAWRGLHARGGRARGATRAGSRVLPSSSPLPRPPSTPACHDENQAFVPLLFSRVAHQQLGLQLRAAREVPRHNRQLRRRQPRLRPGLPARPRPRARRRRVRSPATRHGSRGSAATGLRRARLGRRAGETPSARAACRRGAGGGRGCRGRGAAGRGSGRVARGLRGGGPGAGRSGCVVCCGRRRAGGITARGRIAAAFQRIRRL